MNYHFLKTKNKVFSTFFFSKKKWKSTVLLIFVYFNPCLSKTVKIFFFCILVDKYLYKNSGNSYHANTILDCLFQYSKQLSNKTDLFVKSCCCLSSLTLVVSFML